MPSAFSLAAQALSAAVNQKFGERLRFEPRLFNQYTGGQLDTGRPPFEIVGVFREKPSETDIKHSAAVGTEFDRVVVTPVETVTVDRRDLPANYSLREHDFIIRIDEPGRPTFEISAIAHDGLVRDRYSLILLPPGDARS